MLELVVVVEFVQVGVFKLVCSRGGVQVGVSKLGFQRHSYWGVCFVVLLVAIF
jgi:hypothetical protein